MSRGRSVSEPSLPVRCSNYTRERLRKSDVAYEKGKDKLAHWIGAWGQQEVSSDLAVFLFSAQHAIQFNHVWAPCVSNVQVCEVLQSLVARCPLPQLEYLCTVCYIS